MSAKVIDIELAKAARMRPARFGDVAHEAGVVAVNVDVRFTPAAARIFARHLLERADAAEAEQG